MSLQGGTGAMTNDNAPLYHCRAGGAGAGAMTNDNAPLCHCRAGAGAMPMLPYVIAGRGLVL